MEGKREISSSPPGGESSDRGGDFSKEEFSPTTERGGSEEGGSSLGKELPELSGGEGSPHSEAALRRVRVAEAEALRRAKGRTPQAPLIPYFLTAGGQEIVGLLDTGSSHFLVKKEIFEKMEGKEVVTPTSYKGVEGGVVQQQKGKLVKCQTCFGETDYIAYPQLAQLAVEALVPLQIGLAMGLEVKRVPKYWISKLQKSNDRKWVQSVRERLKETKFPKAQREFVLNRIKRALRGVCPLKAEVFAKMQRPRTGKEVQKVLGFVNFLRDFIPLYSCVVGPLEGLRSTKKINNDLWLSSGGKKAFDLAKEILSRALVLSNLDWSKEFFVETDASQFGVGVVLFQKGSKGEVNIYIDFATKAFNSSQQNYSAVKRELLVGMFALERWRPFLLF